MPGGRLPPGAEYRPGAGVIRALAPGVRRRRYGTPRLLEASARVFREPSDRARPQNPLRRDTQSARCLRHDARRTSPEGPGLAALRPRRHFKSRLPHGTSGPDVLLGDSAVAPPGDGHHAAACLELADHACPLPRSELDRVRRDLGRRASRRLDVCLHRSDVLADAVGHRLALPVDEHVVGVVMGEHAVPVGVVPTGEIEVVHSLEVGADLVIAHAFTLSWFNGWCSPLIGCRIGDVSRANSSKPTADAMYPDRNWGGDRAMWRWRTAGGLTSSAAAICAQVQAA